MKKCGLWFAHRVYRVSCKNRDGLSGNLAADIVDFGINNRAHYWRMSFEAEFLCKEMNYASRAQISAARFFLVKGIKEPTIEQWNSVVREVCRRIGSSNIAATEKAASLGGWFRKPHRRRVVIKGSGRNLYAIAKMAPCKYALEARLERMKRARAIRLSSVINQMASTCRCCGKFDERRPKVCHVDARDIYVPTTKMFRHIKQIIKDFCVNAEYKPTRHRWDSDRYLVTSEGVIDTKLLENKEPVKVIQLSSMRHNAHPVLCVSCWNKIRAIIGRAHEADDIRYLAAKTQRSINNGKAFKHDIKNPRRAGGSA